MKVHGIKGLILAGGKGSRMGRDKALMEFDGERLIDRAIRTLAPLFDEIIVAADTAERFSGLEGARVVEDLYPQRGSVGGLYTGLQEAEESPVFACGCDMPFMSRRAVAGLVRFAESTKADAVLPLYDGVLEPLHAVYSPSCAGEFKRFIESGGFKIIDVFPELEVARVDPVVFAPSLSPEHIFFNVNTPGDLAAALRMANEKQEG